jgi:hypothetical protein
MKQFVLTPAMGKRLIGKAMAVHPAVQSALKQGTLVIVAGTTNGYVAEEVLAATDQLGTFTRKGFRRGIVVAPSFDAASIKADFPGDVVLVKGVWQKGKEIFDVVDNMQAGDVILKGANALDLATGQSAVLIGHPMGGTIGAAISALIGRRVTLLVPIGLEKRVHGNLWEIASALNSPAAEGPRLMPLPGQSFTELDAIELLTGGKARLVAGGGICGAEGAVWIAVSGQEGQLKAAADLIKSIAAEPLCQA